MEELKEDRPQITIQVQPKRRVIEPPPTERKPAPAQVAERAEPATENTETREAQESAETPRPESGAPSAAGGSDEDLKAGLSRLLGKKNEAPAGETAEKPAADKPAEVVSLSVSDQKLGAPTTDQMNPHPDEKLVEESDQGPLPKIDETGRQAWRVYAGPFDKNDKRPRIAVVVTHLGLSPQITQRVITELPGQITLGFAPYARSLGDWIQQARDDGHEVLLGLPMEPSDYPRNDPGPNGLMLANSQEENIKRLNWVLSRASGYVGVFNFMGSRFANEKRALRPIVQQLKNRGLMMLDTRVSPFSVLGVAAQEVGLPYTVVDISADSEPNRGAIDRKLRQVTELATKNKSAVVIVRPFPITMLRLKNWLNRLDPNQIILAPLSAVATVKKTKS